MTPRRFDGRKLVIASHNAGKVCEMGDMLRPFGVEAVSAGDLDLPVPDETEETFEGNARIKARAAAQASGLPALSDDSGLEVDALYGRPGVRTADWAETPGGRDFAVAMAKVWNLLEEKKTPEPRTARFVCILCLAWPDGRDEIFRGDVSGRLVWPMRGEKGFGFDPVFLPDGYAQTFGEMDPQEKHGISHRANAFAKLAAGCFAAPPGA